MKTCLYFILVCLFSLTLFAAEDTAQPGTVTTLESKADETTPPQSTAAEPEEVKLQDIQLPAKDSPDYGVVRSEAISELTPLLTKKRAEMKKKRQMLADYLLKIGKGEDMASQNIEVPEDPALYAKALGVAEGLEQRDVALSNKLPTWDELAEFAMRFVLYEGYVPVEFDGSDDIQSFIDVCKKKEQYAEKVRKEMRGYVKDCLKIWIYLGTIDQQSGCKEWAVQMKLDAEKDKAAERGAVAEQRRMAALERSESEKQRKFEDAQSRASFRSSRSERVYTSREDLLRYRQTRLDERYTNYYRW